MTETKAERPSPRRGGWLRKLLWISGALAVLLVVAYFGVTSGAFFKGVVLPRAGKALNAEIAVGDARISPFSQVVLRDVKVTPKGAEPLLTAREVRARYSLMAILGGRIAVDEVAVVNPTFTLVENADGTSNLDPLLKKERAEEKKPGAPPAKPSAPPSLDLKLVKIENATVRQTRNLKGGGRDVLELANANITLSGLKNGQPGKLDLSAALAMDRAARTNAPASALSAKLNGGFTFDLTQDLMPGAVKGNATLAVEKAAGSLAEAAALAVQLDAEASPTEVKQLALRFNQAGQSLGELRVSGPFDAAKREGKLQAQLTGVDRKLLNLAGAASGLDFGNTTLNATSEVELMKAGRQVSAGGRLDLARFQVTRQGQTTPSLDVRCDYNVAVDNAAQAALLKSFHVTGTQNQRPLLQAALTAPMTIAWGNTSNAVGDSALNLTVNGLDLADWKPFLGEKAPAGRVNLNAKLLSQQAGKLLQFEAKAGVDNLVVVAGTNRFAGLGVSLEARGQATNMKQFTLAEYRAQLAHLGEQVLSAEGTGGCDTAAKTSEADANALVALPNLVRLLSLPDANISGGAAQAQVHFAQKGVSQSVTGKVMVVALSGKLGPSNFRNYGLETDLDVLKTDQKVQLRKASGKVTGGGPADGGFQATGNYDLATKAGDVALKLVSLNQNALRPFLEAALGDKSLVSVALDSTASASLSANGDAGVKADLQVANLVVKNPKGALPSTPLEARVQADVSASKQVAQVRQLQLTFTPTDRAKNQLALTGTVDYSKTNAITGSLKLAAEALDVTRYYDLFAGDSKAASKSSPAPATPASDPTKEPDALNLPFRNFTFDASIGRFYLREVDIANLQATAKLDGGHVVVKPCQLTLNGAPVSATVDAELGVPGFKYDVAFNADKVPLAPLVNSFVPERKGQMAGTITATAQIKGAGVTGASLQKNLTGRFSLLSTNMNLSIANVHNRLLKLVINTTTSIPDLMRDPAAAAVNLAGSLFTPNVARGGFAAEVNRAPLDVIVAHGTAGNGRIELQQSEAHSAAFQAQATGDIALASILTNSAIQLPVHVALSRALANKIGLVSADTPTNLAYIPLPDFLRMKGTLGEPKTDINKLALAGLAARTGAGVVKQLGGATGEKAGGILSTVGNLLGGGAPAPATGTQTTPPAAVATNVPARPATSAPPAQPVDNLLRGLGGLLGGSKPAGAQTNAPARPR